MSGYLTSQAISGLRAILDRVRTERDRPRRERLSAVGLFQEGGQLNISFPHDTSEQVAKCLKVPHSHVQKIQGVVYAPRDTTHDGPFFAYLMPGEEYPAGYSLRHGHHLFGGLNDGLAQLHQLTLRLPQPVRQMLPEDPSSWWASLFHLAVHFPRMFLHATRERWVKVTGPAPGVSNFSAALIQYPNNTLVDEFELQFGLMRAPFEDILPGVILSRLSTDLVSATVAAVELLIERLEQPVRQAAESSEGRNQFVQLHARFALLAKWEQSISLPAHDQSEVPVAHRLLQELQVVKVANSFSMPPAANWCGFPMAVAFDKLLLSQRHADAEYLLTRNLASNILPLAAEAGQALPPSLPDAPVLFCRTDKYEFVLPTTAASLNPDPVARWVRFVLNTLRAKDPGTKLVRVEFLDLPTATAWPPVYGCLTIPGGFFAASVRAIEVAGLHQDLGQKKTRTNTDDNGASLGGSSGGAKSKGGRPKLGEGPKATEQNKALRNVYELIRPLRRKKMGAQQLRDHFKMNTDFKKRVALAGKKFDVALFHAAISWLKNNPAQETL